MLRMAGEPFGLYGKHPILLNLQTLETLETLQILQILETLQTLQTLQTQQIQRTPTILHNIVHICCLCNRHTEIHGVLRIRSFC